MSPQARQPTDPENPAQDYIVEYRAGQFQNGSLVLRFDHHPSEQDLRNALKDFGLPPSAVQDVRARPLNTGRMWEHAASARSTLSDSRWPERTESTALSQMSPTIRRGTKKGRPGLSFLIIILALFGFIMFQSPNSQQEGNLFGLTIPSTSNRVSTCFEGATTARTDNTGLGQFFQDEPTSFPISPQNTAFFVACVLPE